MHSVYRPDTPPSANAKPDILVFRADARQRVALVCPACGKERMLDGRKLATIKQPAAMKCTCGHVFHCRFELDPPTEPLQPPSAATLASGAAASGPAPRSSSTNGGMPDTMAGTMTELPVFSADRQNRFTIICPSCKDARTLDGEKLRHVVQPATMKCRCGNIFKCHFKFFEPEFPPEDPEAIKYHGEDLDLPEFPQMEPDKTFSPVAREAALANRRALLTFRGRFPEEFTDSDPASQTMDPDTLLRNVQPPAPAMSKVPEDAPLPPEAFERIGFPILEDDHTTALPPDADAVGLDLGETDEEGEASQARALAVLRLANLEKKRAREAMTATRAQSPTALIGFPETGPQEPPQQEPAAATLPPPEAQAGAPRKGMELDAHRQALERERQELEALRRRLEEERALVMQQKAELARMLRRVTALPAASQPAALPDVATFAPDASGIIQVQCPGCGSRKALKAADVATVKQPARMKCKQCNTVFSCRFSLEPPTGARAQAGAGAAPTPRSLPASEAIPTFYADLAGNVTLVCPTCHAANTVTSETLRGVEQPTRIRCGSCDTAFPCRFVLGPPTATPGNCIASASPETSPGTSPETAADATVLASKAATPDIHNPEDTGNPALTMQADALGRFAKSTLQEEESVGTPAESSFNTPRTLSDDELSKTMSPERLQALFADHTDEAMALAAVSLKGDALGRYFEAPHNAELFEEDMTATPEENSSPPLVPAIVADVLPVMPFETVPAPEGEDPPMYYVDESRQVMVMCPKCERGRNLDFSQHAEVGTVIRTWCKCGNAYHCRLEFRRNYRKKVNLPGSFYVPANNLQGEMTVTDISLGGVGFTLPAPYGLLPDTIIDLHFTLDDLKKTPIQRRVRVRTVKGLSVGSEFLEQRGRDKDLGYYLMP